MPDSVVLRDIQGTAHAVPPDLVQAYKDRGFVEESSTQHGERVTEDIQHDLYGGIGGTLKTAGAGLLSGATLGLSDVAIAGLGGRQALHGLYEENPATSLGANLVGATLPSLFTGGTSLGASILAKSPAALTSGIGRAVTGIGEGAGLLGRAGAATAGAAAEGALYGGGQYLSQVALEDKPLSAEGFVGAMGTGALFAAPIGGAFSLGESALIRARSLFPQQQVTREAARVVQQEATSAIGQSVADGEQMAQALQQKIALTEAQTGIAQTGERMTRRMFGAADPQALGDQVTGAVERQAMVDALRKYETTNAQLRQWIRTEADPELEAALSGLVSPEVGQVGGRIEKLPGKFGEPELAAGTPVQPGAFDDLGAALDMRSRQIDVTKIGKRPANDVPGDLIAGVKTAESTVPDHSAIKAHEVKFDDYLEQTIPAKAIADRGYYEPPGAHADAVRSNNAKKAIADGQREAIKLNVSPDGKITVTDGRHRLAAAIEADGPIKVKWSTGSEPASGDVLRGGKAASPFSDDEYAAYKKSWGHAADAHLPSEMRYSKGGDEIVNPALRSGKPLEGEAVKLRDGLDAAFQEPESRIPRDATLYRGLSDRGVKERFANVKPGDVLEDPAYTSTTFSEKAKSRNEQVVFTIHAPAGTPALPIRTHFSSEGEMLLPRGTKLRVDSVDHVPVTERWNLEGLKSHEALPDKSVRLVHRDGSVSVEPPIKDIKVTIISEHAPVAPRPVVDLDVAPLDKLSSRQLKMLRAEFDQKFQGLTSGSPEYNQLLARDEALVARLQAIDARTVPNPPDYVAPSKVGDLESQLAAMKSKLDSGAQIGKLSAESPARADYVAAKAEKTQAAAEHFRAKATGADTDDFFANLTRPKTRDAYVAQNIGAAMRSEGSHAAGLARLEREWAGSDLGKRIVASADEGSIKTVLSKRVGKNVDMGAHLERAAKVIGEHEGALADMAEVLGAEAPKTAVASAKAYRAAMADQADASAASAARAAQDITNKATPVMATGGATVVDDSVTKALRAHESKLGSGAPVVAPRPVGDTVVDDDITKALRAHDMRTKPVAEQPLKTPSPAETTSTLGKLANVGAALEVLNALGVHVPALSSIPVIGPILGLYLKAKAVMGIIGRRGGSIGRSTEGIVASKSAETRNRINAATSAILEGGAKGVKKASFAAGPAALLAGSLFPGGDDSKSKDVHALYTARMDELARAQAPGAIAHAIGDRIQTSDPHLLDAITAQVERGLKFLDSKAPKQTVMPGVIPGDGDWKPSKAALEEWAKYVHAVNDPASVLEDLAKGHVTMEGAETLRIVYPLLYAEAQRSLMEAAPKMQKTLSYSRRVAISIMYQVPIDATMTSQHLQFLQPPLPAPSAAPPMPAPGGPAMTGPITIGQQMMPPLDRRAGA